MAYALITGASAGIGYEFVKLFAKKGVSLIIVSRNEDKLNEIANEIEESYSIKVIPIGLDLTETENIYILYERICELGLPIKYLINNAGFGLNSTFITGSLSSQQKMIKLNVECLTSLSWLIAKKMKEDNGGYILNVASIAGFLPGPNMSVYYATKAYVISFSEGLAQELKCYNIKVSVLCPGPTKSNFAENSGMDKTFIFKHLPVDNAEKVAKYGYEQLVMGRTVSIYGVFNKIMIVFSKFIPRFFLSKLISKLQ